MSRTRAKPTNLKSGAHGKKTTSPQVADRGKTQRKIRMRRSKKPFRLLDLPLEIQRIVYDLCLPASEDIIIKIDNSDGGKGFDDVPRGMIAEYDQLVDLTRSLQNLPRTNEFINSAFNPNFLRVSKRVYAEAVPLLYARNIFCFKGEYGLDAFTFFHQRLTETGLASLQCLDLVFPVIRRWANPNKESCKVVIGDFEEWFISAVKGCKNLRLRLDQDVLVSDAALLDQFGKNLTGIDVTLIVEVTKETLDIYGRHHYHNRKISIYEKAIAGIRRMNWHIEGDFEKVDDLHRSRNLRGWIEALHYYDSLAVDWKIRKESAFLKTETLKTSRRRIRSGIVL